MNEKYLDYCTTNRQKEVVMAIIEHGSIRSAAKAIGSAYTSVHEIFHKVQKRAALSGKDPENNLDSAVPAGCMLTGTSRMTKEPDGSILWTKTKVDDAKRLELLKDAISAMVADVPRAHKSADVGHGTDDDLLTVYPIGDAHIGMMAWGEESGQDWDLKIAEKVFTRVFSKLVAEAPASKRCRIIDVGDFLHSDNLAGVTTAHGNVLDMDSRYGKVIKVAVRVWMHMITRALEKHEFVDVEIVPGNHNDIGSMWARTALSLRYADDPRVHITDCEGYYHYYQFGANLIAATHGDKCKPEKLALLMATDVPEMWGTTKYRDWHTGHIHTDTLKDYNGCRVFTHRTLAPEEAYAAKSGYRSGQDSKFYVYHREYGPQWSRTVGIAEAMYGFED